MHRRGANVNFLRESRLRRGPSRRLAKGCCSTFKPLVLLQPSSRVAHETCSISLVTVAFPIFITLSSHASSTSALFSHSTAPRPPGPTFFPSFLFADLPRSLFTFDKPLRTILFHHSASKSRFPSLLNLNFRMLPPLLPPLLHRYPPSTILSSFFSPPSLSKPNQE